MSTKLQIYQCCSWWSLSWHVFLQSAVTDVEPKLWNNSWRQTDLLFIPCPMYTHSFINNTTPLMCESRLARTERIWMYVCFGNLGLWLAGTPYSQLLSPAPFTSEENSLCQSFSNKGFNVSVYIHKENVKCWRKLFLICCS